MTDENASRGERTRDEIVTAAHQLFLERGFHGTSMRMIAQQAGIALGGIYNHFSGKEDIFNAVLLAFHPYLEVVPALQAARGESIEELIRDAARGMIVGLGKRPDLLNLMFIELVEFKGRHVPQLFDIVFPQILSFVQRIAEMQSSLRPIPLPVLLRAFIGLFFSYYITELLLGDHFPVEHKDNTLDHFVDIYLHGILSDG
jgi:AcrR family transcriptional regulator